MKIALFGYGKMGRLIAQLARVHGHEVVLTVNRASERAIWLAALSEVDVAIDFSVPETAVDHILAAFAAGVPVVSGTTGWLDRWEEVMAAQKAYQAAFLYASNFSLGVNLFFALNQQLAKLMQPYAAYQAKVHEIHHIHKLDAPSGTAITLAEGIVETSDYSGWKLDGTGEEKVLPVTAERQGEVPGTHQISYVSAEDTIKIEHVAHNRNGFAQGAMLAAEWLPGRVGVYEMKDVLGI